MVWGLEYLLCISAGTQDVNLLQWECPGVMENEMRSCDSTIVVTCPTVPLRPTILRKSHRNGFGLGVERFPTP